MNKEKKENREKENKGIPPEEQEEIQASGDRVHPAPGEGEEDWIKIKASEYRKVVDELSEYKDKCVRLYAEFENTRKRFERDKIEFVKYANEGLICDFLNIIDDLQRTVDAASVQHQDYHSFLKGVEMVMGRVRDLLSKNNVKPIKSVGSKFDPHCHEVLMQAVSDQHDEGEILEEFQKGYYLGERVIRTAKVKVAVREEHGQPDGTGIPENTPQEKKESNE